MTKMDVVSGYYTYWLATVWGFVFNISERKVWRCLKICEFRFSPDFYLRFMFPRTQKCVSM